MRSDVWPKILISRLTKLCSLNRMPYCYRFQRSVNLSIVVINVGRLSVNMIIRKIHLTMALAHRYWIRLNWMKLWMRSLPVWIFKNSLFERILRIAPKHLILSTILNTYRLIIRNIPFRLHRVTTHWRVIQHMRCTYASNRNRLCNKSLIICWEY